MSKHQEVLNLIEELQKLGTLSRIVAYGPIDTLKYGISRFFNSDVNDYFEDYLEVLDKAILFYNSSAYKVNIDRYTLGELYNVTKNNSSTVEEFFLKFFETINLVTLEIIKAGIDEAYDNNAPLKGIVSLRAITKIDYNSEHFDYMSNMISQYYITVANKPFNIINLFSYLKRFRLDTNFISSTVRALEKEVVDYIKIKYSIGEHSVYSILQQNSDNG